MIKNSPVVSSLLKRFSEESNFDSEGFNEYLNEFAGGSFRVINSKSFPCTILNSKGMSHSVHPAVVDREDSRYKGGIERPYTSNSYEFRYSTKDSMIKKSNFTGGLKTFIFEHNLYDL